MNRTNKSQGRHIILALDGIEPEQIRILAGATKDIVAGGKINDEIDRHGADAIDGIGFKYVMADPKLHDIPATVRNRMLAYRGLADFVTVHASNQWASLREAAKAANEIKANAIAVTILTSMSSKECKQLYGRPARQMVLHFVARAKRAGLHGIVCSPKEVAAVRKLWPKAIIICPGVRSVGAEVHDQRRVDTPENAINNGADFVVVGREVTKAAGSQAQHAAALRIQRNIDSVLSASS